MISRIQMKSQKFMIWRIGLWGIFLFQFGFISLLLFEHVIDLLQIHHHHIAPMGWPFVTAMTLGLVLSWFGLKEILGQNRELSAQLKVASGAFSELLEESFTEWKLTPSERDVALLAIKGLSISEIAGLRQTKEGTIKAQSNSIYRKAGVSGRTQLLSHFIEELMSENLTCPMKRAAMALKGVDRASTAPVD